MKRARGAAALAALCPPRKRGGGAAAAVAAAAGAADGLRAAGREPLSLQEVLASSVLHLLGQYKEPFEGSFADLAELIEDACTQFGVGEEYAPTWTRSCLNVFLALGLLEALPGTPLDRKKTVAAGRPDDEDGISLQRVIVAADGRACTDNLGLMVRRSQDEVLSNIDEILETTLNVFAERDRLLAKEKDLLAEVFPDAQIGAAASAGTEKEAQPGDAVAGAASAQAGPPVNGKPSAGAAPQSASAAPGAPVTAGPANGQSATAPASHKTRFFLPSSASLMPLSLEKELEANASVSSRNANASNAALGFASNPSSSVQYSMELAPSDAEVAARLQRARDHVNRIREIVFQNGPQAFDELFEARQRFLDQTAASKGASSAEPAAGRDRSASLDESLDAVQVVGPRDGPKVRPPKFLAPIHEFVGPNMSVRLHEEVVTDPFDFADIVVQFRVSGTEETRSSASPLTRVKSARGTSLSVSSAASTSGAGGRESPEPLSPGAASPVATAAAAGAPVHNFENAAKKTAQGTDVDLPSWRVHDWRQDPADPGPLAPQDDPRDEVYTARHAVAREAASAEWEAHLEEQKRLKEEERVRRQSLSQRSRSPRDHRRRSSVTAPSPRTSDDGAEAVRRLAALSAHSRAATAAEKAAEAGGRRAGEGPESAAADDQEPAEPPAIVDIPTVDSLAAATASAKDVPSTPAPEPAAASPASSEPRVTRSRKRTRQSMAAASPDESASRRRSPRTRASPGDSTPASKTGSSSPMTRRSSKRQRKRTSL